MESISLGKAFENFYEFRHLALRNGFLWVNYGLSIAENTLFRVHDHRQRGCVCTTFLQDSSHLSQLLRQRASGHSIAVLGDETSENIDELGCCERVLFEFIQRCNLCSLKAFEQDLN